MLAPPDQQRFSRHLLLSQIGEAGQLRLCAAQVRACADADPRAACVAYRYLERAGMRINTEATSQVIALPSAESLHALAGSVELEGAAAALAGAFAAVEAIKHALGVGTSATLGTLCIGTEAAP